MPVQELLVHVSAPSSRKDDERYRRLAQACQQFQPDRVMRLTASRLNDVDIQEQTYHLDNQTVALPKVRREVTHVTKSCTEKSSGNTSVEFKRGISSPLPAIPHDGCSTAARERSTAYIEDTQAAKAALESQLFTSSLAALDESPSSYQGDSEALQPQLDRSSPAHAWAPSWAADKANTLSSSNNALSRTSSAACTPIPQTHNLVQVLSAPASSPAHQFPAAQITFSNLPTTIFAPSPPTSTFTTPTTHVSPAFAELADMPILLRRYQPVRASRPLHPLERGHWHIETCSWPAELQRDFWSYLQTFVEEGRGGWGINCFRVCPVLGDNGGCMDKKQLGAVKIFCWGEVMRHVWLLVFVASKGKVKRVGAKWIDAREQVVVEMA